MLLWLTLVGYLYSKYPPFRSERIQFYAPVDLGKDVLLKMSLIATPEIWISTMYNNFNRLDQITAARRSPGDNKVRARQVYLQMIQGLILGTSFGEFEQRVETDSNGRKNALELNTSERLRGEDTPYLGLTSIGAKRLGNIEQLIAQCMKYHVAGGFVEAGGWRGGASIYARAIFRAYELGKTRPVILCDAFGTFLPQNYSHHPREQQLTSYHQADDIEVANYFKQYNLLDHHVYFAKGLFNDTMPIVADRMEKIAILRIDTSIYQSTMDVLYHLYAKVSTGGFVIIDDWEGYDTKEAVSHFFQVHGISPNILPIDHHSVYWKKIEQIKIRHRRYEEKKYHD
jgi:O-methyltransferase